LGRAGCGGGRFKRQVARTRKGVSEREKKDASGRERGRERQGESGRLVYQ
jgi:hypothetical protein